ncbi:MAG: ABC transporter ATP-binding protein [Alphaproteobacteria bacterium]|jgi:lipoprotein-releasing system ATP-binding protein|nr:ABC transporter ATP-binding protein [Alphaproteobacteria bacterium]MDP6517736.1 ABC transporter ATP-binding protein [Alphaproteobacteria bacterium]
MSDAGAARALEIRAVERHYVQGDRRLAVLRGASLAIGAGEVVALVGPSGSGKSTMLHIAGLLEHPDGGEVAIGGVACGSLSDRDRTRLRRSALGFVYQFHHLLPEFSARENIVLPQMIAGTGRRAAGIRADGLLALVGLEARSSHRPGQLSGGEQQRVAVARALANRPKLLLADEPTGNLDPETSAQVIGELLSLVRSENLAALIATHNPDIATRMDRTVRLADGKLVADHG